MDYEPASESKIEYLRSLDIIVDILQFIENNRAKIIFLAEQKGGWEGWLQAELAYHLDRSTKYMVDREKAVFNDENQQIDLWCTPRIPFYPANDFSFGEIGVELKCEGMWQDTVVKEEHFYGRVLADLAKVQKGIDGTQLISAFCHVYAVGVTTDKEDIGRFKLKSDWVPGAANFSYWASSSLEGSDDPALYVFWWQAYFPRR